MNEYIVTRKSARTEVYCYQSGTTVEWDGTQNAREYRG